MSATKLKKRHEEHENHERWLVSYADFITLMFAFFVIMYATSNNNEEKQKKFEDSVRVNLRLGAAQSAAGQGKDSGAAALVPELAHPIEGFPPSKDPQAVEDYVDKEIEKKIGNEKKQKLIPSIKHDLMGLRITLAASAFFPVGQYKLKRESLSVLDEVAGILKQTQRKVIIEGHTDDLPFVGEQGETNWELASLRATSVIRYLIKVHQIDPQRLAAISYADQKPIVENSSEENRAKNRRIEVLILDENKTGI